MPDISKLVPVNLHEIYDTIVPERDWAVPDLVPMGALSILTGDSGVGKSMISAQLARAIVLGESFLGRKVNPGPVVIASFEDDTNEILRRFQRMGSVPPAPPLVILGAENLGHRGPMVRATGSGAPEPTALHGEIRGICAAVRPRLVVIDPLACAFAGDENDRAQASATIAILRAVAPDAAVLLITHASVAGLADARGGSGSTGWRAAARAQLNLSGGRGGHKLSVVKANYGPLTSMGLQQGRREGA